MTLHGRLAVKRPADVPVDSLVSLVRSYEEHITGVATCTHEDILLETSNPGYEENSWCLTGPGDVVLAWAALTPRGDVLDAALTSMPGPHGESAARTLLCLLLDRADELVRERGRPCTVTVGGVLRGDLVVPSLLREAGFVHGATAGQYDIDLAAPPLPPLLPDGGSIRPAGPHDAAALHMLHLRSMTQGPKTENAAYFRARLRRLRESGGVALLLEVRGHPVGHVLAQSAVGEGRVLDLGVAPAYRGLGIGLALLTAALAELRGLGAARALFTLDTGDLHDHEALPRVLTVRGARFVSRFNKIAV
ncbi:GNAT family N-acetyltransferase [Streptomyces sp. ICN441]|uniref:GNAT family N-acetyltransferase n=1 Tax=Streptomyces sp. ICN441 TaxID=2558286 RepID=UPI00106DBCA6|nr:GNAT family N-acetyltransferase [Streptomyces sp. ICN441]TFE42846.1 GNAT family N-acetyltransferase [Streptomyces sp. ICN441]